MLDLFSRNDFIIFTTRDFANEAGLSLSAASRQLSRLAEKGLLAKVTRGVWANAGHPHFHPMACVPHLLGKEQGYISFLTALHLHGLLSQIPATVQVATTGHPRKLETRWGTFEFLQIKPELMQQGVGWSDTPLPWLLADPEKALLDTLYLATRRGRRFASLPELELDTAEFDPVRFRRLLSELPYSGAIRRAIESRAAAVYCNLGPDLGS